MSSLQTPTGRLWLYGNGGVGNQYVASYDALLNGILATMPVSPDTVPVLINAGVNDMMSMPTEAAFEASYWSILDKIHTKWPSATVYVARPWARGYGANATTIAGWIATVVAGRSFAALGHDERVWLEGGDDGATMTTDGIHYTAAGKAECAAQWQTVLGY